MGRYPDVTVFGALVSILESKSRSNCSHKSIVSLFICRKCWQIIDNNLHKTEKTEDISLMYKDYRQTFNPSRVNDEVSILIPSAPRTPNSGLRQQLSSCRESEDVLRYGSKLIFLILTPTLQEYIKGRKP